MEIYTIFVSLGCLGVSLKVLWEAIGLRKLLTQPAPEGEEFSFEPLIQGLQQGISDTIRDEVENTVGKMAPPSAQDHLFGLLNTFISAKMMKSLQMEGLPNLNVPDSHEAAYAEAQN